MIEKKKQFFFLSEISIWANIYFPILMIPNDLIPKRVSDFAVIFCRRQRKETQKHDFGKVVFIQKQSFVDVLQNSCS